MHSCVILNITLEACNVHCRACPINFHNKLQLRGIIKFIMIFMTFFFSFHQNNFFAKETRRNVRRLFLDESTSFFNFANLDEERKIKKISKFCEKNGIRRSNYF